MVLGWAVIAFAGLLLVLDIVVARSSREASLSAASVFFTLAGMAIAAAGVGVLLVVVGRSHRAKTRASRLRLWAKCTIAIGTVSAFGMSIMCLGVALDVVVEKRDPEFWLVLSVGLFLISLGAIAFALIRGRNILVSDMVKVFD